MRIRDWSSDVCSTDLASMVTSISRWHATRRRVNAIAAGSASITASAATDKPTYMERKPARSQVSEPSTISYHFVENPRGGHSMKLPPVKDTGTRNMMGMKRNTSTNIAMINNRDAIELENRMRTVRPSQIATQNLSTKKPRTPRDEKP